MSGKPNVIDWMRETAKFMAKDRPDIYESYETAMAELDFVMNSMREEEGSGLTSFASYMLIRYQEVSETGEVEVDEWDLVRKISSVANYADEPGVWAVAYTKDSGVLKYGVEGLPDILDEDLEI